MAEREFFYRQWKMTSFPVNGGMMKNVVDNLVFGRGNVGQQFVKQNKLEIYCSDLMEEYDEVTKLMRQYRNAEYYLGRPNTRSKTVGTVIRGAYFTVWEKPKTKKSKMVLYIGVNIEMIKLAQYCFLTKMQ